MFILNQYGTKCKQLNEVEIVFEIPELLNIDMCNEYEKITDAANTIREDFEAKRIFNTQTYPQLLTHNESEIIAKILVNGVCFGSYPKAEGELMYDNILKGIENKENFFDMRDEILKNE